MEHDMTIEWLTFTHQPDIIEQEYDGMEAVDGFSQPLTDWDFESPQP